MLLFVSQLVIIITMIFTKNTLYQICPWFAIRCLLGTQTWMMEATLMLCVDYVDGVLNTIIGQQADWLCVWDCAPVQIAKSWRL